MYYVFSISFHFHLDFFGRYLCIPFLEPLEKLDPFVVLMLIIYVVSATDVYVLLEFKLG